LVAFERRTYRFALVGRSGRLALDFGEITLWEKNY